MTDTSMVETGVLPEMDATEQRPRARSKVAVVLYAPFQARFWRELLDLVTVFVLGCLAVSYLFLLVGGGLYLCVVLIGVPVLAAVLLGGRVWGRVYRAVADALLDTSVEAPPALHREPGFFGFLKSAFTDRVSWRAMVFLLAQCVLGLGVGYVVLVAVVMVVFCAISPIPWALFHPVNIDQNGVERHSLMQFGSVYIDTWPRVLGISVLGILGCWFVLPWLVRGVCGLHRMLTVGLLSATSRDRHLAALRASRRVAVDDAAGRT